MDFGFSDEQSEIQSTAREFLADRAKPERVREHAEAGTYDEGLWSEVRELGWTGIPIPESEGGQGLGMVELAIVCEQLGAALAPIPFLSTVGAALVVDLAGSEKQRSRWLSGLASGETRGAVAMSAADPFVVPDAEEAEVIAVPGGDSPRLLTGSEARIDPLDLIDATRRYFSVSADGGEPLTGPDGGHRVAVALAAELTGVAQRAMDMAVDYAKEREQFGRPIGAYQAVSHRCADMLYEVEEARSLTYYAAWCADADPDSVPLAASMAKARASDAAWNVTASALQVFGGTGFTWEHDLHFLLKRARASGRLGGSAREHRDRVAAAIGLG